MHSKLKRLQGYSLIELLIVITIIAVLSTVAVITYNGHIDSARKKTKESALSTVKSAFAISLVTHDYKPELKHIIEQLNAGTNDLSVTNATNSASKKLIQITLDGYTYYITVYTNDGCSTLPTDTSNEVKCIGSISATLS